MALFETLKYCVVKKDKSIEIREYQDFLLASTTSPINQRQDSGFMAVFDYISGQNDSKQKISMTTPVVTFEEGEKLVTGFYVPSKFNQQSLPSPLDRRVFINQMNHAYYAVIRFSGSWKKENIAQYDQKLTLYLTNHHIKKISTLFLLRYQPPFVPGIFRRNEIAYQIAYNI